MNQSLQGGEWAASLPDPYSPCSYYRTIILGFQQVISLIAGFLRFSLHDEAM
jgi:hypothetical protein